MRSNCFSLYMAGLLLSLALLEGCAASGTEVPDFKLKEALDICVGKVSSSLQQLNGAEALPHHIGIDEKKWHGSGLSSWTCGFFPGMLWYMYELEGDSYWKSHAIYYTDLLTPVNDLPWKTHDLGFMMYTSFGHGYRLTKDPQYKEILLESADTLAQLYDPEIGLINSWPWMKRKEGWYHTTIIENMMNLKLLFWAARNGNKPEYRKYAEHHAQKTIEDFIRPDFSTYRIAVYDSARRKPRFKTSIFQKEDSITLARGHAFAIYGFKECYRETNDPLYLVTAEGLADYFITHLSGDYIPYWILNQSGGEDREKETSSAAIAASALLDLAELTESPEEQKRYNDTAYQILTSLFSPKYLNHANCGIFLNHGHINREKRADQASFIFTDYYGLEALFKYWKKNQQYITEFPAGGMEGS